MKENAGQKGYNLLNEPWIPVKFADGRAGKVSLRAFLLDASSIRTVSAELPQMTFAILRLALAVLYRAFFIADITRRGVMDMWRDLWTDGQFDLPLLNSYFDQHEDGFDLFDEQRPFFQTAGLMREDGSFDSVAELMLDIPKPDKYLFAMKTPQYVESLAPDEAARYLVLAQAYDTAGIKTPVLGNTHVKKGKVYAPQGNVGTGWCGAIGGVYVSGNNLFETLMLNWVLYDSRSEDGVLLGIDADLPPWEVASPGSDQLEKDPRGPVGMLTWQSRRIRLSRNDDGLVNGVISCYGDVTRPIDKQTCEMMTPWRTSIPQQKKLQLPYVPFMPNTHDPSRALWRGLSSIIAWRDQSQGTDDMRPGVVRWIERLVDSEDGTLESRQIAIHAQGMEYGTQNSTVTESVDDSVDLNILLLRHGSKATDAVLDVIERCDEAVKCFVFYIQDIEKSLGDKRGGNSAKTMKGDAREHAYDELDLLCRTRLARLSPDDDLYEYRKEWCKDIATLLRRLAREYIDVANIPLFKEHDGMTSGKAFVKLDAGLKKALET